MAHGFLDWLAVPVGGRWLDVGCGTGAVSRTILDSAQPEIVLGVDLAEHYVTSARERIADPRATFEVGDARRLPKRDGSFYAVVSGLVLSFVPATDQLDMIIGMYRAARGGGVVAAYVWDSSSGMQMMRHCWDAAIALDPAVQELDQASASQSANCTRSKRCFATPAYGMSR